MRAQSRLISVVAALLMALADRGLSSGSARAEDNCLAAPNAPAAPGSHWHYRTDSVKQSKCWYLRADDQAIQTPAAQQKTETNVGAKWSAPAMPKTASSYQAASEANQVRPNQALADRLVQWSIQDGAQSGRQARANTVAWPDPPSQVGADTAARPGLPSPAGDDNVVWPNPPSQTVGARQKALENTAEERANQTQEEPSTAATPDKGAVSQSELPAGLFLAVAFGLVIAGIIMRRMVRAAFSGRRRVFIDRRAPVETTNVASDTFVANHHDFAPTWVDDINPDDEAKEALRKLLLLLDHEAA
jgi:hypothetical protein